MPIYEYSCSHCHEKQEIIQKVADPTPDTCPLCHTHNSLVKSITAGAFHLKGGGWYKDLYGSAKPEKPAQCGNSNDSCGQAEKKVGACSNGDKTL